MHDTIEIFQNNIGFIYREEENKEQLLKAEKRKKAALTIGLGVSIVLGTIATAITYSPSISAKVVINSLIITEKIAERIKTNYYEE